MLEDRQFTPYQRMEVQNWYNQRIVRSSDVMHLANNTLAAYAGCRRNQQVIHSLYETNTGKQEMVLVVQPGQTRTILSIPADGLITGDTPLKAYVYCSTASDTKTMTLELVCGSSKGSTSSIESTTEGWHAVVCHPERIATGAAKDDRSIFLMVCNEDDTDSETITIDSISIFEEPHPHTAPWLDWTGASNKVGVVDQPFTPAMFGVLKNNLDYVVRQRMPKANIYNRSFIENHRSTVAAYAAGNDALGRYMVRTKADVDELQVLLFVDVEGSGTPKVKFRVGAYNLSGSAIGSAWEEEVTGLQYFFGKWVRSTIDISGRTAGDDIIEIRVDSKDSNGTVTDQALWNICVVESAVATDVTYELPNRRYVQPDDDIRATDILNIKNTLTHLYNTGVQILLNDLRVHQPARQTKWPYDYFDNDYGGIVDHWRFTYWNNLNIARGVLYPSEGANNLVLDVTIQRPQPSGVCGALKYTNDVGFESVWDAGVRPLITATGETAAADTIARATGRLIYQDVTNNIIYMDRCAGEWVSGDEIERDDLSTTADIDGTLYEPTDSNVELYFYAEIAHGAGLVPQANSYYNSGSSYYTYAWKTHKIGNVNGTIRAVIKLPIPDEYVDDTSLSNAAYNNTDHNPERKGTLVGVTEIPGPTVFTLRVYSTASINTGSDYNAPYVRLCRVYEETPGVL